MIEVIVSQRPTPPPPSVSRFPAILGWFDNPRLMTSQPQLTKYAVRVNRPPHLPGPLRSRRSGTLNLDRCALL